MTTNNTSNQIVFMDTTGFLDNWQANRRLTRRIIEAFPEKELFAFSLGGMRTFAEMTKELLAIAAPGLREVAGGITGALNEDLQELKTKADLLKAWDRATEEISEYYTHITPERFSETVNLFGQYSNTVIDTLTYFVENEIHHRGQGYVYLRALGIEPPYFWEK